MKNYLPRLTVLCVWLLAIRAAATTYYVDINSTNPTPPYTNWSTASTDIQSAVNETTNGDLILVNPGVYQSGGYTAPDGNLTTVLVTNQVTLQSADGPNATLIDGSNVMRCIDLGSGAILTGFTVTNGATPDGGNGGGINCESTNAIVTNCVIIGNAADNAGGGANQGTFNNCIFAGNAAGSSGGGANNCVLNNCILTNNVAGPVSAPAVRSKDAIKPAPLFLVWIFGGGAESSVLNNCIVTNNSAQVGGGLDSCTANNCLILDNNALFGGGVNGSTLNNCTLVGNINGLWGAGAYSSTLNNCIDYYNVGPDGYDTYNYCCSDQDPTGAGDITNDPAFVDWQNNDFHLTPNSPCINSGDNLYVTTTNDFDGNPRIVGGTVDMGAYEYQTPTSVLSYAWAQQYGLPTDGSVDYSDLDGTGMNNWQKWIAGLDPTNPASVLVMLSQTATNNTAGVTVTWQSVDNRNYYLLRATNLAAQAAFWPIASNILGQAGTTSYTDPCATNNGPYFYRVGIQ